MADTYRMIGWAWMGMVAIWLAGSFTAKRTIRKEPASSRVVHLSLWIVALLLFWGPGLGRVAPNWQAIPRSPLSAGIGLALTIAGLAIAIWARFVLGRNWSGTVTLKQDHELIQSGPYALVRHPIYSGILLALLGTAIARGDIGSFAGVLLATIGFRIKSLTEESFMLDQFGSQYAEYKSGVKALIPFVW